MQPKHATCGSRDSNILVVVPQNDCTALMLDARKLGK
jgi:hypothetical protein